MTLFIHLVIHTLSSGCSSNFIYSVYNACNHNYEKKREMKPIATLFLTIITCSLLLLVRSSSIQQCAISGMNCPSNSVFDEDQCACLCLDGFKVGEDPSNPESIICREVSSATTQSTECPGGRVLVRGACVCPVICPQFFTVAQECTCSGPVCPKNTIWNGVSKTCVCDTSVCGPHSIQNSDCSCTCNSGFVPGNKLYLRNTFWCRKPSDPECPDGSAIPIGHSECACTPGLCEGNSINEFSSSGTTCTCNTCGNPDISIVSVKNNVEQCVPRCEGLAKFNSESQQCECNTVCGQGSTLTERCSCKCNKGYAPLDASQSECQLYTSCRPGYSFNADTQRCEKDNVVLESCPLGVSQDKDGFCICINKCGSNQELTPTCGCTCKAGTINSTNVDGESKCMAACPDGVLYNRYWSECMCSNSCGANEKHDNDCNCVCSPGFHLQTNENGEKRCMEKCKPNYFYSADWSTCICSQQQQCRSDQIAGGECGCTCREGEYEMTNILGETKCMPNCPFLHMKYDMSWSKCECDNQCGLNQYREDDCSCSCKPGFVWALNTKSQPGCALKCKINEVHDENFQCVCTTGTDKVTNVNGDMSCMPKCPGSKVYDPSWQQCVCPNSCPDSFVRDDDTCDCVCQDIHLKPFKNTIGQESCQVPCNTNEEYDENWKCKCKDGFTKVTENGLCTSIVIAKVAVTAEQLPPYFNADGTRTLIGDVYLTNIHNIAEFLVEKERTEEAILLEIVIKAREKVERLERLLRELKEKARILYQEIQILRLILELIPQLSDKETASDSLQVMIDLTVQVEKEYKLVLEAIERTERELVIAREELAIAEANYWADASMRHYTLNVADVAKQRIARVDSDRLFMKNILYNTDRNSKTYTCTSCDVQLYGCELSEAVIVKDPHTGCEVCQCKPIIPRQLREYNVQIGLLPDGTQVLPNEKIFEHIRPADLRVSAELQKELDRDPSLPRSSAQ